MAKITLTNIGTLTPPASAVQSINDNMAEIARAMDTMLSRDGQGPNQMEAPLDMNSEKIMNVADPEANHDAVNLETLQAAIAGALFDGATVILQGDATIREDLANGAAGYGSELVAYDSTYTVKQRIDNIEAGVGGDPTLRADLAATGGGALVSWKQADAAAVSQTVVVELARTVRPEQFGGVGDGVADDTVAVSAAITYLNSIGWSRPLYLGSKKWKLTSAPTIITAERSPTIIGDGALVWLDYVAGDGFTFYSGSGGPQIQNANVVGVEFDSTVVRTSGAAVRGLAIADMRVDSCTFRNQFGSIKFGVYQYPTAHNCTFLECKQAIEFDGGSGGTVSNCRAQSGAGTTPTAGTKGLVLTNASGVMVVNTDLVRLTAGVYAEPATGAGAQFLFMTNVLCDTCDYGMQMSTTNGGTVTSIFLENCWFSSCNENGIYALGVKNIRLNECEAIVNRRVGLNFITCEQVRVTGGMIGWNNVNNAANDGGISLTGVLDVAIRRVLFTNKSGWLSYGAVSNQKHAVSFLTTASSNVTLEGNTCVNHSIGDLYIPVAPTGTTIIKDNRTSISSVLASAANITVTPMQDSYTITGTTTVENINLPALDGQIIRLRTTGACTITDTFNFKLAGNFVGTANSILTLMGVVGVGWVEVSRAIV